MNTNDIWIEAVRRAEQRIPFSEWFTRMLGATRNSFERDVLHAAMEQLFETWLKVEAEKD